MLLLILIALVISKRIKRVKNSFLLIFLNIILGLFFCLLNTKELFSFLTFRMIYGSFLFGFSLVFFFNFLEKYGYPKKIVVVANYIYLIVSLLEALNPSILGYLTVSRTDVGRGLTSLTPEPSYFGTFLIFCSLSLFIDSNFNFRRDIYLHILNLLFIIFLAKSSLAFLFLLVGLLIYFICSIRWGKLLFLSCFLLFFINFLPALVNILLPETRIRKVVSDAFEFSLYDLFQLDASFNQRLEHIVVSFEALLYNNFLPGGVDSFVYFRNLILPKYNGYFWYADETNIIMSWVGDVLFHYGFFGITIFIITTFIIFQKRSLMLSATLLFLFFILLTPVPMGFSVTYLILAQLLNYNRFKIAVPTHH